MTEAVTGRNVIQDTNTVMLACGPNAPGQARRIVVDVLVGVGEMERFPDAELVVSELVTNAVLHSGCDELRVDVDVHHDGRLRLAVVDPEPSRLPVAPSVPRAVGGRGLKIIDAVAADWGVQLNVGSKVVWAELQAVSTGGNHSHVGSPCGCNR